MPKPPPTITAIEIGSNAIKLVMAECPEDGAPPAIIGCFEARTQSKVLKGEILDYEAVSGMLTEALNKLETTARASIRAVVVAVTGSHVGSVNAQATVPITAHNRVITEEDALDVLG